MGVGAGLWEHLSAVKTEEKLSSLRDKRLAIDLSYWLVQQQQAVKGKKVLKPHLRLTFFRVIKLIARVGARPVFVVDGEPPPLKKTVQEKRSRQFAKHFESECETSGQSSFKDKVEECVVMLEYLGIPVIRAEGEAESLCAELDRKDLVDFCVTPDSDAFVHGAKRVIKNLQADPKDPLVELYQATDIKERLHLHQRHLLALALLVGCDYTEGIPGVGLQSALRLVQCFSEDEILDRLRAWGKGELPAKAEIIQPCPAEADNKQIKYTHCSKCGHLGNKRDHTKLGCQTCNGCTDEDRAQADFIIFGCNEKSKGFRCTCHVCIKKANQNEETRSKAWWTKICRKMAAAPDFPNETVIDIFLKPDISIREDLESLSSVMAQQRPNMEQLESFLKKNLYWDAAYVRDKTLPLLSHFCLAELAAWNSGSRTHNQPTGLINDLFRPCCIERVKIDYSEELFMLKWETVDNMVAESAEQWLGMESSQTPALNRFQNVSCTDVERQSCEKELESSSNRDHCSFTTNENIDLVRAACPELAEVYNKAQVAKQQSRAKKAKRKRAKAGEGDGKQSRILSYYHLVPTSNTEIGRKPQEVVSRGLTLDRSAMASSPCDVVSESHAFFRLGTDVEYEESGSFLATASPLGSPEKLLRKKAVSRKLTFL
ncbi:unnamed protein product [Calypogeia fissa]